MFLDYSRLPPGFEQGSRPRPHRPRLLWPVARRSALRGIRLGVLLLCFGGSSVCAENSTLPLDPQQWPRVASAIGPDAELEARAAALLSTMTLAEKVGQMVQAEIQHASPADVRQYHLGSVLNGGGSWPGQNALSTPEDWVELARAYHRASIDPVGGRTGIPVIWGTDAVHGHNNVVGATLFPHNIGLGAANDPILTERIGRATALETAATGIDWVFSPTLAVARDDRWGRTYESFSEDPEIVARLGAALTRGLQGASTEERFKSGRVLATAKHFLGDGGTLNGRDQGNVLTDERALREIHGTGYFEALAAGAQTVMASFSSWRGRKMHGNKYLLTTVLKGRMGFDGFIIGDWNGHGQLPGCTDDSCAAAINAGIDMIMVPEEWRNFITNTLRQVRAGEIAQSRIDDAVRRILRVKLRAGLFDKGSNPPVDRGWIGHAQHRALARQAARASLVLLKNRNAVLPLQKSARVLVAGHGADDYAVQTGGWTITWQGTDNDRAHYRGATTILQGIRAAVEGGGGSLVQAPKGRFDTSADAAIVVFGEPPYAEGEGDRQHLVYHKYNRRPLNLLGKLRKRRIPTIAVFLSGRPMVVNKELDAADAFVAAWLPGSEGGAIADLLFADNTGAPAYQFTGRLPFSWPRSETQLRLNRDDDVYLPLFPVGYGLRY